MRIINRAEFLALEGPVLYSEFTPMNFGEFFIKVGNSGDNDWVCDRLSAGAILNSSTEEWLDLLDRASANPTINLNVDFEYSGRDGCFNGPEVQFAIFEKEDVLQLVQRLLKVTPGYVLAHGANLPVPKKPLKVRLHQEYGEEMAETFPGFLSSAVTAPSRRDITNVCDLVEAAIWKHLPALKPNILLAALNPELAKKLTDPSCLMPFSPPIVFCVSKDLETFQVEGGAAMGVSLKLPYDLMYMLYADRILEAILEAGKKFPFPIKPFIMWNHPTLHSAEVVEAVMGLMPEIINNHPRIDIISDVVYKELQTWEYNTVMLEQVKDSKDS